MDWKTWLEGRYTLKTAAAYAREIKIFLELVHEAQTADYQAILGYIKELRQVQKRASLNRHLQGLKKYYQWLQETEQRADNPAAALRLQDAKRERDIQIQDLLSIKQLNQLWDFFLTKKYRYKAMKNRILAIVSLLVFQGLTSEELCALVIGDIDLQAAQVRINATKTTNGRTLPLEAQQILILHNYLAESPKHSIDAVFSNLNSDSLHYLISSVRPELLRTKKLSPLRIRQSVIASKFKQGWDLRKVQLFAGHRYPSSTEAYRLSGLADLKLSVEKHHPLG
jgi:integrase/recombinase XerD